MTVAGLMSKSKYSHNVIRAGDIMTNAPFTVLNSEMGAVIQLPLPTNLSSAMGADWQQESVSPAGYLLRQNKEAINDLELPDSYMEAFKNLPGAVGTALKKGYNGSKADIMQMYARTKGRSKVGGAKVAMNPRNEMLFNGMQFKTYSFTFMLVPYSKKDSSNIQKAIKEIQKASVPEMKGVKMLMMYPETWWITFKSGDGGSGNEYLMKINECCCTGVNVNYSPNGETYQMHDGNAPLAVELTLDFTEMFIPSKDNIDQYNG